MKTTNANVLEKSKTQQQIFAEQLSAKIDEMNARIKNTTGVDGDVIKSLQIDRNNAISADKEIAELKEKLRRRTEIVTKGIVNEFYANLIVKTFAYRWGYKTDESQDKLRAMIIDADYTIYKDGKKVAVASIAEAASFAKYLYDSLFAEKRGHTVAAERVLSYYGGLLARFVSPENALQKTAKEFNLSEDGIEKLKQAIQKRAEQAEQAEQAEK